MTKLEERVSSIESALKELIQLNKKIADSNLTEVNKRLGARIAALESRMLDLEKENTLLKQELEVIKEQKDEKEGSLKEDTIAALTEAITKDVEDKMEAKQSGWVEVVKKNIKKEVKEEAQKEEHLIVHSTLEEEKMRHARRLNVRVTGLAETKDSSPEADGRTLCEKLAYKKDDPLPFAKAWRAGKDTTRARALILQFSGDAERTAFLRKRVVLRDLPGEPIYLDDDLTRMQIEHRKTCMPRIIQARKEGKRAVYRDGHVIIDGKTMD